MVVIYSTTNNFSIDYDMRSSSWDFDIVLSFTIAKVAIDREINRIRFG